MFKKILALSLVMALSAPQVLADDYHGASADTHAPIGVMGDHTHNTGEWMLSYRYMRMEMDEFKSGDDKVKNTDLLMANGGSYMAVPESMTGEMHMFGAMYAPSDELTLMVMLPYIQKEMDIVNGMGAELTTKSSGFGDAKFGGLFKLHHSDNGLHKSHLNLSVSLPTGDIEQKDMGYMGRMKLPYNMQLGSGSYELLPGVTYLGRADGSPYSWGAQAAAVLRTGGENSEDYRLGNETHVTAWLSRSLTPWVSTSFRLAAKDWDGIHGSDSELNAMMSPTADTDNSGGKKVDASIGLNVVIPDGALSQHRFAVEVGTPVYEDYDGVQMATDWTLTAGWQLAL